MHIDHELVEFVPIDEQEYEEVIEEYEEEILMQEGFLGPFGADLTDPWVLLVRSRVTGILWELHA